MYGNRNTYDPTRIKRKKPATPKVKTQRVSRKNRVEPNFIAIDNCASCIISGGIGNNLYQIAFTVAYALKHGIKYEIPSTVRSPHANAHKLTIKSTGIQEPRNTPFQEQRNEFGFPYVQDLPLLQNPLFHGYWQFFGYFDWCREEVLKAFDFPSNIQSGITSIHVRRGDAVLQSENFPMLLQQYYTDAIEYMNKKGYFDFKIFSDDIPFTRTWFSKETYPNCNFTFVYGGTDYSDLVELSNCENHIVARSTFSFMGAWICQNPNKIVLCPPFPLFKSCHSEMIPPYFTIIDTPINTSNPQAQWAMQKKQIIDFTPSKEKLKLDTVTLLCVATKRVDESAKALMYSCKEIDFKAVKLVSPYRPSFLPKEYEWEFIEPFENINDWCHEITYNLHRYFDTDRVILIHNDGYIINPQSWSDEFLDYDFIGSPYSDSFAHAIRKDRKQGVYRVGNSVSIRSRKLCKLPSEIGLQWRMIDGNYNEDVLVSIHARELFEKHGVKYPPLELACKWGRETEFTENAHITEPFCFHRYNGKNKQYPKF